MAPAIPGESVRRNLSLQRQVAARVGKLLLWAWVLLNTTLAFLSHVLAALLKRLPLHLITINKDAKRRWVDHLAFNCEETVTNLVGHYVAMRCR